MQGRPRSPLRHSVLRSTHTATALVQVGEAKQETRATCTTGLDLSLGVSSRQLTTNPDVTSESLPEHDELHVGPYGVEAPLHWDFVVKVTEVTVTAKADAEHDGSASADSVSKGLDGDEFQAK